MEQAFPEMQENPHILTTQIWNDCLVRKELLFETVERLAPGEFSETQLTSVCTWAVRQYQKRQEMEEAFVNEQGKASHLDEHQDLETENLNFMDLNDFTKISLIFFMILAKIEIIAVIYLIKRFFFKE